MDRWVEHHRFVPTPAMQPDAPSLCFVCGVEFGYQDATLEAVHRSRERWRLRGYTWHDERMRPTVWGPEAQAQPAAAPREVMRVP
ncbi:hypothetical protein HEB94_002451 [Actinopolymorpha pittospori]|uniref:Uncharacterized protein n=1 Tax=Actinopolymorpha pittospori TaxID=648752 RepID=A0A927MUQ4_9ACTN|nr:hypothetical protein [Actinopolymorpha pittospori]